jgi:hypothetical protein
VRTINLPYEGAGVLEQVLEGKDTAYILAGREIRRLPSSVRERIFDDATRVAGWSVVPVDPALMALDGFEVTKIVRDR